MRRGFDGLNPRVLPHNAEAIENPAKLKSPAPANPADGIDIWPRISARNLDFYNPIASETR